MVRALGMVEGMMLEGSVLNWIRISVLNSSSAFKGGSIIKSE